MESRKLSISRERLAELTTGELAAVAGGSVIFECEWFYTNRVIYTCRCVVSGAGCA